MPVSRRILTLLIAGLILVKGLLFVLLVPPWQGPDEPVRLEPAVIVAREGVQLKDLTPDPEFQRDTVASMRQFRAWAFYERKPPPAEVEDFAGANLPAGGASFLYESALSYWPNALVIRWLKAETPLAALYAGRIASLLLHLVATLLVAALALEVFRGADAYPMRAGVILAYGLHPQLSFVSAVVHPDNLGMALGVAVLTLLLLVSRRAGTQGVSFYWVGPLCLTLVLGGVSGMIIRKLLILIPLLATGLPLIFWPRLRKNGSLEGLARLTWIILAVAFLFGTALYLKPETVWWRLYVPPLITRTDELREVSALGGWFRYGGILYSTFWLALGSLVHKLSPAWLALLALGSACGGWGWLAWWLRADSARRRSSPIAQIRAVLLALWLAWVFISVLAVYGNPASNVEGRYLLMALPAIVILWIAGLSFTEDRASGWEPVLVWTMVCVLLNWVVVFDYLIPIYYLSG